MHRIVRYEPPTFKIGVGLIDHTGNRGQITKGPGSERRDVSQRGGFEGGSHRHDGRRPYGRRATNDRVQVTENRA